MLVALWGIDGWVIEALCEVVNAVAIVLEFIAPVSHFVEVLPDVDVEVLSEVIVNVSAVVMTALEFPMPIPEEEFSC